MTRSEKVVALLLPGPSLPETWDGDKRYHEVVAVNAAVRLVGDRPAWWLIDKPQAYLDHRQSASRAHRLVALTQTFAGILAGLDAEAAGTVAASRCYTLEHALGKNVWAIVGFLSVVAMVFANRLAPTGMVVYGADFRGNGDFTGAISPAKTTQRWQREQFAFEQITEAVRRRGVKVVRAQPTYGDVSSQTWDEMLRGSPTGSDLDAAKAVFVQGASVDVA